jgi:hypothetical protein
MSDRLQQHPGHTGGLRVKLYAKPWLLLVFVPVLLLIMLSVFRYGMRIGERIVPNITDFFYTMTAPSPAPTPTPLTSFPTSLPQVGVIPYTVQAGDSCDEILTIQMRMQDAGQLFSDAKPNTVKALGSLIGQDCHRLQPGMVIRLAPHYPLVALSGVVLKVEPLSTPQPIPTPLITIPPQSPATIDCASGCVLTVRIAPTSEIRLLVQTALPVHVGSQVWAQAMLARKHIANFANYPFVDPEAELAGMTMSACDLQIDRTHDPNGLACDQLLPNTIDDDGGAWLFGVTGPGNLGHWGYQLGLPSNTAVLIWLTSWNGTLSFHRGNPVYRYNERTLEYGVI